MKIVFTFLLIFLVSCTERTIEGQTYTEVELSKLRVHQNQLIALEGQPRLTPIGLVLDDGNAQVVVAIRRGSDLPNASAAHSTALNAIRSEIEDEDSQTITVYGRFLGATLEMSDDKTAIQRIPVLDTQFVKVNQEIYALSK